MCLPFGPVVTRPGVFAVRDPAEAPDVDVFRVPALVGAATGQEYAREKEDAAQSANALVDAQQRAVLPEVADDEPPHRRAARPRDQQGEPDERRHALVRDPNV